MTPMVKKIYATFSQLFFKVCMRSHSPEMSAGREVCMIMNLLLKRTATADIVASMKKRKPRNANQSGGDDAFSSLLPTNPADTVNPTVIKEEERVMRDLAVSSSLASPP